MSKNTQISELINYLSVDGSGNIVITGSLIGPAGATYATQSYVTTAISNLVNAAPTALDTLAELSAALNNDASFATTVTNSLAGKQAQLNGTGFVKISGSSISYDNSTYLTTSSASSTYLPLVGGALTGGLTGTTASFSSFITAQSTGGSGLRIYGSSGTNQWDIYLNSTNLRFSDNTGTGSVVFDRPISGTSATLSSSISIGGSFGFPNGSISATGELSFNSSSPNIYTYGRYAGPNAGRIIFNNGTGANLFFGEIAGNIYGFTANAYNSTAVLTMDMGANRVGIGVTPSYPLDMITSSSGTFNTIAQFQNTDYTSGNRSFIRVRQWVNAGGSSSSYFGTGQDGKTYIISNDSARGGDIIIDNTNGYIGINKSSPSRRLHLYDGSPSGGILSKFESGNSSGWLQLTSTSSSWQLGATVNGFEIYNDGTSTTRVYIATTGEFGIGTSTLSQKFNVEGAGMFKSTGNAELTISSIGGASSSSYIQAWNPSTNTFKNLLFYGNDIIFRAQSTSVEIERMRLTGTNGYLGLGTDIPQGTFHILKGSGAGAEVLVSYGSTATRSEFVHNSSGGAVNLRRESDGSTNTLFRAYGDSYLGAVAGNFAIGTSSANGGRLTLQGTSNTFDVVMKIHKSSYADTGGHTSLLGFGCESASWSRSAIGHTRTTSYDAGYFGIYVSNNSSDGSQITSSDLRVKVNRDGNMGIMDATYVSSRLSVDSAVKIGRKIFGWYQATMPDGYTYYHMKTNLYGGGAGNSEYTMSLFTAEFYSYSGYIRTGTLGFHNWSGALYTVVTTGNAWATPYISSDGYVVLVIATGGGSYLGLNVDWNQVFNYGYRDRYVTAATASNSATGVY